MSDLVLQLNRTRDRPPTPSEVAEDIRRLGYSNGGALSGAFNRDLGLWICFVVAFTDRDDSFAPNIFSGKKSALEFWQRDHVLTGIAFSELEPDSHWEALACAKRQDLERFRLCVWFDRGTLPKLVPHYKFFRRAPRDAETYRPQGPEITVRDLRQILAA
jgi:hypothetical protein